jgi:hypothetical protein
VVYASQVVTDLLNLRSEGKEAQAESLLKGLVGGNGKDAIDNFQNTGPGTDGSGLNPLQQMIAGGGVNALNDTDVANAK